MRRRDLRVLLHFGLLGALLFGLAGWIEWSPPAGPSVLSDDEILFRTALADRHHLYDPVVRERLVRNMRFLEESGELDEGALLDRALELGLEREDLVVRRRLAERMRRLLSASGAGRPPSSSEIRAYYAAHENRFRTPERISLTHVFVSSDRGEPGRHAEELRTRIQEQGVSPEGALAWSDPFLLGHVLPLQTHAELARRLGDGFSERVWTLRARSWSAPIRSVFGLHLVWVRERRPASVLPLALARARIEEELQQQREERSLRAALTQLRPPTPRP